jgi:hypothetical protein
MADNKKNEVVNKSTEAVAKKIDSLTPEQEALLDVYCNKYIKIGMSTDTDKPRAEKAFKDLYKQQNLEEPEIRWFDSPLAANRGAKEAGVLHLPFGWEGSFDAGYASFYKYAREVLGCVEETNPFLPVFDIIESCGPSIECDKVVFVSVKPSEIYTDEQGELHNENGPSFSYPDGFKGFFWHGFAVPEDLILRPQDITVERIQKEDNTEIRRILLERFGTGRFIAETGGEIVDEDHDDINGDRQLVKDKLGNVLFHVCDISTGRAYWLDVPPDTTTCVKANEFLSGPLPRDKQVGRT